MLYREMIAVCSQIHTKHKNTLRGRNVGFFNIKPGGKYSELWALKSYVSVIKTSQLMLYREIIAVCFELRKKTHKYTVWMQCIIFEY